MRLIMHTLVMFLAVICLALADLRDPNFRQIFDSLSSSAVTEKSCRQQDWKKLQDILTKAYTSSNKCMVVARIDQKSCYQTVFQMVMAGVENLNSGKKCDRVLEEAFAEINRWSKIKYAQKVAVLNEFTVKPLPPPQREAVSFDFQQLFKMAEDNKQTKNKCQAVWTQTRTVLKDSHSAGRDCRTAKDKRACFKKIAAKLQNYFIQLIKGSKGSECQSAEYKDLIKRAQGYGKLGHAARNAAISEFLQSTMAVAPVSVKKAAPAVKGADWVTLYNLFYDNVGQTSSCVADYVENSCNYMHKCQTEAKDCAKDDTKCLGTIVTGFKDFLKEIDQKEIDQKKTGKICVDMSGIFPNIVKAYQAFVAINQASLKVGLQNFAQADIREPPPPAEPENWNEWYVDDGEY